MFLLILIILIILLLAGSGFGYSRRSSYGHYGYGIGGLSGPHSRDRFDPVPAGSSALLTATAVNSYFFTAVVGW